MRTHCVIVRLRSVISRCIIHMRCGCLRNAHEKSPYSQFQPSGPWERCADLCGSVHFCITQVSLLRRIFFRCRSLVLCSLPAWILYACRYIRSLFAFLCWLNRASIIFPLYFWYSCPTFDVVFFLFCTALLGAWESLLVLGVYTIKICAEWHSGRCVVSPR